MFRPAKFLVGAAALALGPVTGWAGVASFPGLDEPTYSQADLDAAFASGRGTGQTEMANLCIGDPGNCGCDIGVDPCGIALSSVLTGAQFGETEPNDHIVAADALITGVIYWGQSRDLIDQDWFYLTTVEPNQILTLTFTVPDRVLVDNTRLSQGWMVGIKDAAGNIYAQFDTRFALDDPDTDNKNESKEITYPVFLGHVGTYYVTVEPQIDAEAQVDLTELSILYWPYNLAATLTYSGLDAAPPDVNFHDVEVEPNNDRIHSNPLASGVTMYGFLHQTTAAITNGTYDQSEEDWYRYTSPGNEQVVLAWCGREACAANAIWTVELYRPNGILLVTTTTDKADTLHVGLDEAGDYFLRVRYEVKTDAICARRSDTALDCAADEVPKCFLETANQYSDNNCTAVANATLCDHDANAATPDVTCDYAAGANNIVWTQQDDTLICNQAIVEPDTGCNQDGLFPELGDPAAADPLEGAPLYREFQYQVVCDAGMEFLCLEYAPEIDTSALNVQYNFTWWGSRLLPLTNGSDSYDVFLERPGWYEDR